MIPFTFETFPNPFWHSIYQITKLFVEKWYYADFRLFSNVYVSRLLSIVSSLPKQLTIYFNQVKIEWIPRTCPFLPETLDIFFQPLLSLFSMMNRCIISLEYSIRHFFYHFSLRDEASFLFPSIVLSESFQVYR